MHITPFTAYLPDLVKIRFDDDFYKELRENFNRLFNQDIFRKINTPCYFILEILDEGMTSTGLITMTDIRDYLNKKILKHEQTIIHKEKLHAQLFLQRKAMIKPASLLIGHLPGLQRLLERLKKTTDPVLRIQYPDARTTHTLWIVDQPTEIKALTELFKLKVNKAIIADGHHRFATQANRYIQSNKKKYGCILTVYFTENQMKVSGFFRIIEKLKSATTAGILQAIKNQCSVWTEVKDIQSKKGYIHLMVDQATYRFKLKTKPDPLALPFVFSKNIVSSVFKINDETKSQRIYYTESTTDADQLKKLASSRPGRYIFILPDLTARDILKNKKILPPKSTFFLPRIINGLVIAIDPGKNKV